MIPLYDDNPRSTFPIVTLALIGVNVLVFLLQQLAPVGSYAFMMVPSVLTGAGPGQISSAQGTFLLPPPGLHPVWLTIFSSMFMHGGLMHIGGNMLYLWIFGDNIEDDLGHFKYLFFYLAVGFVASVAHVVSGPTSTIPTLGASGAIAGVMGGYILLHPRTDVHCLVPFGALSTLMRVPAWIVLGVWFVYQVLLNQLGQQGGGGGVAYAAHIGGFVAGLILIKLFGPKRETARESYWR
ncbi:MAG TPA: rhomboid family intramembrane serine protease [Armatimonadota bacterium]